MGSDIVYAKVPTYFAADEDDELSKLGVDCDQKLINGHEYLLLTGATSIVSFNESSDKEDTVLRYFRGSDGFMKILRMNIKEFIELLRSQDITIID